MSRPGPLGPVAGGTGRSVERLCPSAPMLEGAVLHALCLGGDSLVHIVPSVPVELIRKPPAGVAPEAVMRFAASCAQSACTNWSNKRSSCDLIDSIVAANPPVPADRLVRCHIRSRCVWFAQQGANACTHCSLVVTKWGQRATTETDPATETQHQEHPSLPGGTNDGPNSGTRIHAD